MEKTDFTEVEIAQGDWRLRVERGKPAVVVAPTGARAVSELAPAAPLAEAPTRAATPQAKATPAEKESPEEEGFFVTSPFVGTFYRSPSPDTDPYVELGQAVKAGQVLCIVEAMKLMNEIESDIDGVVEEIFIENGKPIEYGQKLFSIKPV